ncbi:putative transcription factor C3H family [Helianthus anomalus]
MPPRKEPCRNFQRGYCQYGERCKFLHVNQQQAKPNQNPFGFGSQNTSQPQKPNPFGFGTQTTTQPQKPNPFGFGVQNNSKANQFKPGENKWSRFSPSGGNPTAPQKQDSQSSAPNHVCTDPESCKRQISEDFQQEKPLWKLTCYGHSKYGPCDIIGDVSYEELRASAYDDAKRGTNVQSIVEKERSLLNSKLIEFENLLRNPYKPPSNSNLNTQNTLPGTSTNAFPQTVQNNAPPAVSSFNQLGSSFNTGFQTRASAPNNAFGQVNQFQAPTQISNAPQKNTFAFGIPGVNYWAVNLLHSHLLALSKPQHLPLPTLSLLQLHRILIYQVNSRLCRLVLKTQANSRQCHLVIKQVNSRLYRLVIKQVNSRLYRLVIKTLLQKVFMNQSLPVFKIRKTFHSRIIMSTTVYGSKMNGEQERFLKKHPQKE